METGAVKQAYNNEVILLKKKLNQAKIQIIHKLTRKAKELTEKKGKPLADKLREKNKRKAEAAVKEVLIIKKIKPRDVGRFIVTHKGNLQDYLNKPQVDNDKACARLLLHKAMQEKYTFIRSRFSNVPIKDLFMSRQERLKMRKEEQMKKKEKQMKKLKKGLVNAEGDWDVEDLKLNTKINNVGEDKVTDNDMKASDDEAEGNSEDEVSSDGNENDKQAKCNAKAKNMNIIKNDESADDQEMSNDEDDENDNDQEMDDEDKDESLGSDEDNQYQSGSDEDTAGEGFKISFKGRSDDSENESDHDSEEESNFGKLVKYFKNTENNKKDASIEETTIDKKVSKTNKAPKIETPTESKEKKAKLEKSKGEKKDLSKNKNLNEKILNKKFKKDPNNATAAEKKIVDPFFITDTGENYLSIVEPRAPDEIKVEHRRGNRKMRRAAMFGHVPKIKPRQEYKQDNNRFGRQNGFGENHSNKFERPARPEQFQKDNKFNNKFNNNNSNNKERFSDNRNKDEKPEKLHPSWEAKKKQSGLLPFQGKKIVFDDS